MIEIDKILIKSVRSDLFVSTTFYINKIVIRIKYNFSYLLKIEFIEILFIFVAYYDPADFFNLSTLCPMDKCFSVPSKQRDGSTCRRKRFFIMRHSA